MGLLLVLSGVWLLGCEAAQRDESDKISSKDEALSLAVSLANEQCMKDFSAAPFDVTSYTIEFNDDRWKWGTLDPLGIDGYSAIVTFDSVGGNRHVEVFLSTDKVTAQDRTSRGSERPIQGRVP